VRSPDPCVLRKWRGPPGRRTGQPMRHTFSRISEIPLGWCPGGAGGLRRRRANL